MATTIFFESTFGQSQSRAEASLPEIKTNVCGPDVNMAGVDTVLEGLAGTCFCLQWERHRYRFGLARTRRRRNDPPLYAHRQPGIAGAMQRLEASILERRAAAKKSS